MIHVQDLKGCYLGVCKPVTTKSIHLIPVLLSLLLFLSLSGVLHARLPSAVVVEIACMDRAIPPPPCEGLSFSGREFRFSQDLYSLILEEKPPEWIFLEPGFRHLEDVSSIVIYRNKNSCKLWLSRLQAPPPSEVRHFSGIDRWLFHHDGSITVIMGEDVRQVAPLEFLCIKPHFIEGMKGDCEIMLYNHGVVPIWVGDEKSKAEMVFVGDSVSGRFSGPGDRRVYTVPITKPGMLAVEYRSGRGPGSIDIAIIDKAGKIVGRGGAAFEKPQNVRVELTYRGYGTSDFDAGFLFTPDTLLDCTLKVQKNKDLYKASVTLKNRGDEPVEVFRLEAGTVTWYADGVLIGGAHPGRPPEPVFLGAGASLSYEGEIRFEGEAMLFEARIDLPHMSEGLRCLAGKGK